MPSSPASTATTPAPTATTPSQPTQQQPSASTFNPAPNQPSPVGTWRRTTTYYFEQYTFNANGTGVYDYDGTSQQPITWTASGNRLTINLFYSDGRGIVTTSNYTYEISGNTLRMLSEGNLVRLDTYPRR